MSVFNLSCEATNLITNEPIQYTTLVIARTFEDAKAYHCLQQIDKDIMVGRVVEAK